MRIEHPIPPFVEEDSRILILGSFPSVKSREEMFFYGHKQNRFWRVMASLTHSPVPSSIPEKMELLKKNRIALYDVIYSCEIKGSSDASITSVIPTDLKRILEKGSIKAIFTNGSKSHELYQKYQKTRLGIEDQKLPSTSPANADFSFEKLEKLWSEALSEFFV